MVFYSVLQFCRLRLVGQETEKTEKYKKITSKKKDREREREREQKKLKEGKG